MDELFQQLEIRIRDLIERCEQLEYDNLQLEQDRLQLHREKEALAAKNKMAISHIEGMISRLKSIEGTS